MFFKNIILLCVAVYLSLNNLSHAPGISYWLVESNGGNLKRVLGRLSKEIGGFKMHEIKAFVRLHMRDYHRVFTTDGGIYFNLTLDYDILQLYDEYHFILNYCRYIYAE